MVVSGACCMLGKKNKRVDQSCVTTHQKVGFPLFVIDYDASITKGGVGNASGGIGSGDGEVQS